MKNLNKTTKTILFASLIAALILPFSGMMMAEAAPNENASDKAKDRFNYKVEILEKIQTSQKYVDGVKITTFTSTIKQTEFPTVQDFKDMNEENFKSLDIETQNKLISEFETKLANVPEVYEIQTTKVGEHSITAEWFTRDFPSAFLGTIKDPANMIFRGNANDNDVEAIVDSYASHGWQDAVGGPQWLFVDETAHGGWAYWAYGYYNVQEGCDTCDRYHMRIFDGGNDSHGYYGNWSVGAVHKETWNGSSHDIVSNGWEIAESHLKGDLLGATGISYTGTLWLNNQGPFQGETNSGYARLFTLS